MRTVLLKCRSLLRSTPTGKPARLIISLLDPKTLHASSWLGNMVRVLFTSQQQSDATLPHQAMGVHLALQQASWVLRRPQALMLLCDYILNSMVDPPGVQTIYHTLLQLCLVERLSDEQLAGEEAAHASQALRRCGAVTMSIHGDGSGCSKRCR